MQFLTNEFTLRLGATITATKIDAQLLEMFWGVSFFSKISNK